MFFLKFIRFFAVIVTAIFVNKTYAVLPVDPGANSPTNAGQILQEIERDQNKKPLQRQPQLDIKPKTVEPNNEQLLKIKHFNFEGNKIVGTEDLNKLTQELLSRDVTLNELKNVVNIITDYYRKKGYIAVVSLPEQDITEGEVKIKILESKIGKIKINGIYNKDFYRVNPNLIKSISEAYLNKHGYVNLDEINHGLTNANDLPGIRVTSSLKPGDSEGLTDVVLEVKDKPFYSISLSADNSGSRSIGRERYLVNADLLSPLHYGDDLNFIGLHTEGSDFGKFSYEIPIGSYGLRSNISYSRLEYKVILDGFESNAIPQGNSDTRGINFSYPILNSPQTHFKISTDYTAKRFLNEIGQSVVSDYGINVKSLTLSGDHYDSFLFLGGTTNVSLVVSHGNVNLTNSPNQSYDSQSFQAEGDYTKARFSINRTQFIKDDLLFNVLFTGQLANKNLDSSEKFYLGGMSGVRAYPSNEAGGSEGFMFNLEIMKFLPHNFSVSGFADYGRIKQNINNYFHIPGIADELQSKLTSGSLADNLYAISGYGASVGWQGPYKSNFKAIISRRMGENPNMNNAGLDQDGTKHINNIWLTASILF